MVRPHRFHTRPPLSTPRARHPTSPTRPPPECTACNVHVFTSRSESCKPLSGMSGMRLQRCRRTSARSGAAPAAPASPIGRPHTSRRERDTCSRHGQAALRSGRKALAALPEHFRRAPPSLPRHMRQIGEGNSLRLQNLSDSCVQRFHMQIHKKSGNTPELPTLEYFLTNSGVFPDFCM